MGPGYTLVICEKPDAARRVADALSGGRSRPETVGGTTAFRFVRKGEEFVVCAAQGHLYGVSDPCEERVVYPVFDVEWYILDQLDKDSTGAERRIAAVRRLATGATRFVNACDFDVEGETIGFNLLKYACGGKERDALRAKFSTLTEEDLVRAFDGLEHQWSQGLAKAGRARHAIDFLWGINLSRALSQSPLGGGTQYRTISVGRVQGPTLGFIVEREREILGFVPVPYWKVMGTFEKKGKRIVAPYAEERVPVRAVAERAQRDCLGGVGVVEWVRKSLTLANPPVLFNIGDLQKEAYRAFGFPPGRTMRIAERLYLDALISYPRTGSQKLPPSIDCRKIVRGIERMPEYATVASEVLKSGARPAEGSKSDPAHPAIHPTGEKPRHALGAAESSLLDLIIRRFLAAFGPPARKETVEASLAVGVHRFRAAGSRTLSAGWMKQYGRYAASRDVELPQIEEGERFRVGDVKVEEKFGQRPPRYSQSTLLEKMEREGIGTKATRADIVGTVLGRGYASGEWLEVTELGFAVAEAIEKYAPSIAGTGLTREIEERLAAVEEGKETEASLVRETIRALSEQLAELSANEEWVGRELGSALSAVAPKQTALGICPVCKTGELKVVRSRTTKKRFAGCSNYPSRCRASAPLPQRGSIRATAKPCERCSWPVVYVAGGRHPWKLCVNPACPGRNKS
ncbi:MAG: DNA topoisomerase I [Nitrososphaerota archaeon]|nr:DNA topoisomerase I [Nitrososphaerota archaeon]